MCVTKKHPHATTMPPLPQVNENNDDLKDFLSPMLKMTEAHKVKKFGANMKTCTQAIGMEIGTTDKKVVKTQKDKEISKKKNEIERMNMNEIDETEKCMK